MALRDVVAFGAAAITAAFAAACVVSGPVMILGVTLEAGDVSQ
jgi:hypothetical protein